MKKIIKKLFIPILFIGLLVFAMTDSNFVEKTNVEAASSEMAFNKGTNIGNTSIRIAYTSDLFVAEDFGNELDGVGGNSTIYVTVFLTSKSGLVSLNGG